MKILFINHSTQNCGVADYGRRLYSILKKGMDIDYCDGIPDYSGYDVALYNYHYATMPVVNLVPGVKHVALFHEAFMNVEFDKVIPVEVLPRLVVFREFKITKENDLPTIGSFGFGFPDKNFPGLCEYVKRNMRWAIINLNIPFAKFGDENGHLALHEVEKCEQVLKGTEIFLKVSHRYMPDYEMVSWLNDNDINFFNYAPSHGRGISSCIDYALSARRPIAVSNSEMFRHLPREICIDNATLPELISRGIEPLKQVYEDNTNEKLIAAIWQELKR